MKEEAETPTYMVVDEIKKLNGKIDGLSNQLAVMTKALQAIERHTAPGPFSGMGSSYKR